MSCTGSAMDCKDEMPNSAGPADFGIWRVHRPL